MKNATFGSLILSELEVSPGAFVQSGRIVRITEGGRPLVDFEGNRMGPLEARTLVDRPSESIAGDLPDLPVLLVFERGDLTLPIIVGFIRETFGAPLALDAKPRRIVLEAREEVVIRSGKSSVTLHNNGDVVTKASRIVSRASRTNKIRGPRVSIN